MVIFYFQHLLELGDEYLTISLPFTYLLVYSLMYASIKLTDSGRPGGTVVKFACSASQQRRVRQFGSQVRTWHRLACHAVVGIPRIK